MTEYIHTDEERDRALEGTMILDGDYDVLSKGADGQWRLMVAEEETCHVWLPARVLFRPECHPVTDAVVTLDDLCQAIESVRTEIGYIAVEDAARAVAGLIEARRREFNLRAQEDFDAAARAMAQYTDLKEEPND